MAILNANDPLDDAGRNAQDGGDVLMESAPVGHSDDLEAVPDLAVGGFEERSFEALSLQVVELDADHGANQGEARSNSPTTFRMASADL